MVDSSCRLPTIGTPAGKVEAAPIADGWSTAGGERSDDPPMELR
jgi:hypothetical protein